jgi:uncharacterized protein
MGLVDCYYFDTYALLEIIDGNINYKKFNKKISINTTWLNLMEMHYALLRIKGVKEANFYFDFFLPTVINVSDDIIKESNKFRYKLKRKKLSYVDCIGYTLACLKKIPFVTGDKEFENLENVEFIK